MPPTTFGLTPEQENDIKKFYPSWPWADLAKTINKRDQARINDRQLPKALDDESLHKRVQVGRTELQKLLECDIADMIALAIPLGYAAHPASTNYQVQMTNTDNPGSLWTFTDESQWCDNVGYAKYNKDFAMRKEDGKKIVNRKFDHVLSVLESLPVGPSNTASGPNNTQLKWEQARTINSAMTPKGPTYRIEAWQDKPYRYKPPGHPEMLVDCSYSKCGAFYNVLDGAIIVTKVDRIGKQYLGDKNLVVPPPKWGEWRDITWYCWSALHSTETSWAQWLTKAFPPHSPPTESQDLQTVSGRSSSIWRADLKFYQSINHTTDVPRMRSFLNYVIFCGDAVSNEDVSTIRRCIGSRQHNDHQAPVWGFHHTFTNGHWAFYALLATHAGTNLVKFLYEHKSPDELGKKVVRSITVFAADSVMTFLTAGNTYHELVKWPVLLFEIGDFSEDTVRLRRDMEAKYNAVPKQDKHGRKTYEFPNVECERLAAATSGHLLPRIMLPSNMTYWQELLPGNMIWAEKYQGDEIRYY